MAIEDSIIYQGKKTQPVWAVGNNGKTEEKKDKDKDVIEMFTAPVREQIKTTMSAGSQQKKTTEKKSSSKSTTPVLFKPRTLLETTITGSKEKTRANTNNRFEPFFTPRTAKNVHSKRIKEIDDELAVLGASWKVLKSNGESEDKMKRYETRMAELRKEKESLVKSGVMFAQGHVKTMDSVSAVEDLKSLTRNDVERSRAAEQKREEEREKQYEQDSVKASNFWQKEKKQERDTTESLWRPEFDRSNAFAKSDNDEVVELAKDPKKLKIADGSKEAEYYVKGWGESQKDYPRDFLYLDKTSDNSTEVPLGYVITQDEYDALMYIRGKYGKDEAEKYIRTSGIWDRKIKAEGDAKYRETIIRQGRENPVASYIGTMVTAVPNAVAGYSYTSKKIANKIAGYEKHDTSSEEDWFNNNPQNLWQEGRLLSTDSELLQSIYTGADFVARNIVELSAGGTVGKVAKGLGAGTKAVKVAQGIGEGIVAFGTGATDKYTEQAQYGTLGKKGSVTTAIISGSMDAVSWGFMRKGTDKLAGKMLSKLPQGATTKVLSNSVGSILSGIGVGFTRQTLDNVSDAIIMQNNSRYNVLVDNYKASGMSEEKAEKLAFSEAYVRPMASAVIQGGLMSFAMSLPDTVVTPFNFTMRGARIKNGSYAVSADIIKRAQENGVDIRISKDDTDRMVEASVIANGLKYGKDTDAYKNAELLRKKVNKGRIIDNSEIGAQDILNQIEAVKQAEYAEGVSRLTGARIEFGADLPDIADGMYEGGTIKIADNADADGLSILKHEMGHLLKDGAEEIYRAYETRIKDNATVAKITNLIKSQYAAARKKIDDATLESEVAAEIGISLMPKSVDDLNRLIRRVEGNPTLYDRVHNSIRDLRAKMYAKRKKTFVDPVTGFKINYGEMLKFEKTLEDALVKVRGAELKGNSGSKLKGIRNDGIEVYETSKDVMNMSVSERKRQYIQLMSKEYAGRTARFVRNGHTYYAEFDRKNLGKPMYGDTRSSDSGKKALTRIGADGDIFDLVENSEYDYSAPDTKKHKNTDYFDYFIKTVQIDNKVYDLLADVKKQYGADGGYVYSLILRDNTKIKVAPAKVSNRITSLKVAGTTPEVPFPLVAQRPSTKSTVRNSTSKNIVSENSDGVKYKLKSPDVITYGKDLENVFRDIRLSNVTDDEIKGFAGVTRQMIDYAINARDYSADDFVTQLDEAVDAELGKNNRSIGETIDITNTIIYEIRHISLADIGKREASVLATMQMEAAAGRADGEVFANAKAELNDLRKRKAMITGVFSEPPKNRGEYALSSVGKKSYKIMEGAKNKAEFDAAVEDRLDKFVYRVTTNEESGEYGMKYVATHDNDDTQAYLENKTAWDEYDMATAAALVGEFNALGESERAAQVLSVLSARATQAGKTAQATSHVYKLNASGKIEWWRKANERATERDINSRANKNALNAKKAECAAADARERAAAKELLSESDTEYRKLEDEESRLKKDLAARNDAKKKAEALIKELEAKKKKADNDADIIARMLDADRRAQARRAELVREKRHRELLKKLDVGEEEINRIIAEAKESPEEYYEFFVLMDAYYEVSGRKAKDLLKGVYNPKDRQKIIDALKEEKALNAEILEEIENEYGTVKKPSEYESEMKELRRKVLEIRKAKRTLEEDTIMTVIRVNDDGEIDPDGEHYVSYNPDATEWEAKKATGKRGNKEAVEHYKSHLDEFYEKAGIRYVSNEKLELLKDYASAVEDIDDVDDMLDVIMDLSKIRNTATGSWREALSSKTDEIRSKMYRGIEKLGTLGFDNGQLRRNLNRTVNSILTVSDKAAKKYAEDRVAVEIARHTPDVILNNVEGAKDLKILINYTKLYLATRNSGVINGNYHNLGADIVKRLPDFLENPDAIIQLDNGRLNLLTSVKTEKGNNGIISLELNSPKDINGKNDDYNVVVTMLSSDDNYVENLANRDGVTVKYKREDLPQVNPQLYKYLATINGKSSPENSISQGGGKVKAKEHNPIKRNLKKAFGDDVEALREIAVSQLFGIVSDVEARDLGAKAKTGMFICHLMNGATTFKNILSNAAESGRMGLFVNNLGALIERTFTPHGERTIGFENPFSGAKAGWERMRLSRLETALNVDILKNDTSRLGAPLRKRTFTKGPMAVLERGLGYILGATDEYFKGATEYQVKQGLKRHVENGRITQAEADRYAEEQMLYRTFQNDSKIAEASKDIRNLFNRWGIGEADENGIKPFGLGDFINAYPLVSGNILDRVIDVTPVGALKAIYNSYRLAEDTHKNKRDIKAIEMPIGGKVSNESKTAAAEAIKTNHDLKRKTILSISSALTNGALIWAGMALFKNGIITGNPSADEEEDYERSKNNSQYGINISRLGRLLDGNDDGEPKNGDLIMPVGFLGNLYTGLGIGAELVQGNEQEMNFLDNYFSSNVMSAKEQFLSMSMISNINRMVNNFKYSDTIGEGFAATGADVLMTALPSVVRQFGNAMDDYGRDPYKGATYLDIISGKFKSKIPKVREGEPLRIDLFGEAEVHTLGNKWADIGNNMLSPGIISKYETNVVTDEIDKLTAKNKDLLKEILPKTPYRNNTGEFENGQAYSFKLDDENYEKYANLLGMTTYKAMHTLVTSDDYKHLTDTQKTTALAEISKESAKLVKEIWVSHQQGASDSSMQKRIDKYVASNKAKASKVVKTDNALKYIKLDGVKVEDVIDAGYRVPYTEEEKIELIGTKNYYKELVRSGTYKDASLGGYSRYWTDEDRQYMLDRLDREMRDIASGVEEKWVTIRGEFKNLTDKEKGIVIDQIGYNIDEVTLPDNIGELVDTSVETEPVDLTYPFTPRTSGIIDTGWRADEYDREQSDKKKAEATESEAAKTESKSVEEYLSEYNGSGGYNNYSRNYSNKSYNNSYGGGSSGSGYRFTPSVQPVQKNTYRFTPRFSGGSSRFGKKF